MTKFKVPLIEMKDFERINGFGNFIWQASFTCNFSLYYIPCQKEYCNPGGVTIIAVWRGAGAAASPPPAAPHSSPPSRPAGPHHTEAAPLPCLAPRPRPTPHWTARPPAAPIGPSGGLKPPRLQLNMSSSVKQG